MAGEWMKMDVTTPEKPEVYAIAVALGITREEVVGRLFLVWRWFDQHTENGHASVTLASLSSVAGLSRFVEEMEKVGWLSTGENYVEMVHFDRHNSKSAKKRALAQMRQSRKRHASVTLGALPEKRREYITTTPKPPVDNSTGKSKPNSNGKWWETEEATLAEATARGLHTRPGESWFDFRARIRSTSPSKFKD